MRRLPGLGLSAAFLLAACSGSTKPAPAPEPAPEVAARRAPDFTLDDTTGTPVALHDLLARGPVILAFFPKAFTGG